jgi:wyosine [tRNA(Phe)-imidazoG37] synthetase (radical SAM superfamily)
MRYRHLFGPVPSRRLGLSLGIDLCPMKTCSMDCVFCQLGSTACSTLERREYVPLDEVLQELEQWLGEGGKADCLTLSGAGEPTLHSRFGEVLRFLKTRQSGRSALLSNGGLFTLPEVRRDAALADVVKVSLSAWDHESFQRVNRPHPGLQFDEILLAYSDFRREFRGALWVEVFLIRGTNDGPAEVRRIAELCRAFRPDRIHLNTAVRPPADPGVNALTQAEMEVLADYFTPRAGLIAEFSRARGADAAGGIDDARLLAVVCRHPATAAQVADACGWDAREVEAHLQRMLARGEVLVESRDHGAYYYTR